MAKLDSTSRSRDLVQMLAKLTIDEEPPPLGSDLTLNRFATQSDDLSLAEENSSILVDGPYSLVYDNLLDDPNFDSGIDDWTKVDHANHTIAFERSSDEIFNQGVSNNSLKVSLSGSSGVGITELKQRITDAGATVSSEIWVKVLTKTGSPEVACLMRSSSGSSSVVSHSGITTDWKLLKIDGYSNTNTPPLDFVVQFKSGASGDRMVVYIVGARASNVAALQLWNRRFIIGRSKLRS